MNDLLTTTQPFRRVDAGRGSAWWTEAWSLFVPNLGPWLLLSLVTLAVLLVLNIVPLLGSLAASLIAPMLVGSWMLASRKVDSGGTPELNDLATGFQPPHRSPLLVVGALVLAVSLLMGMIAVMLGLGAVGALVLGGLGRSSAGAMAAAGTGLVALAVTLLIAATTAVALWFAPALIVFRGMPPVDALKTSVAASLGNLGPFLVYGLLYIVASILASIPFGLGWIVLLPLTLLAMHVSYRDIFEGRP